MKLPMQARSIIRSNRITESQKVNINPQALAHCNLKALKQVSMNALKGVMS